MKQTAAKVNLAVVQENVVMKMLAQHGIAVDAAAPLEQRVQTLAQWYLVNTPKNRIADCSTCGGESDVSEPCCPYCGDGEVIDLTPPKPVPQGTSGQVAPVAPPPQPKTGPVAPKAPQAPPSPPPPAQAPVTGHGEALPDALPNGLVRVGGPLGLARPLPPAAEPPVVEQPATLEDLNDAVARVVALKKDSAQSIWELGKELGDIYDRGLWRLRPGADGKGLYKSWGHFCDAELGLSHGYSLRLIDVSREFTKQDVAQVGSTKLMVTLSVTKDHRPALLEEAKSGASVRDLKTKAQELPQAPRGEERGQKGGAGTHRGPKQKPPPPPTSKKITIAMVEKRVELLPKDDKGNPLKVKVPRPYVAEERMFNGVRQRVIVTNDEDGFLVVSLERSRE